MCACVRACACVDLIVAFGVFKRGKKFFASKATQQVCIRWRDVPFAHSQKGFCNRPSGYSKVKPRGCSNKERAGNALSVRRAGILFF